MAQAHCNKGRALGGAVTWYGYAANVYVNARNSFGGYTGFQPYTLLWNTDGTLNRRIEGDNFGVLYGGYGLCRWMDNGIGDVPIIAVPQITSLETPSPSNPPTVTAPPPSPQTTNFVTLNQTEPMCRSFEGIGRRLQALERALTGSMDFSATLPPGPPECVTPAAGTRLEATGKRAAHQLSDGELWFVEVVHQGETRWVLETMISH